jgi:hypothetical protein
VHGESQKGVASKQQVHVHAMAWAGLWLDNKESIGHHSHYMLQHWMQYFHHGL